MNRDLLQMLKKSILLMILLAPSLVYAQDEQIMVDNQEVIVEDDNNQEPVQERSYYESAREFCQDHAVSLAVATAYCAYEAFACYTGKMPSLLLNAKKALGTRSASEQYPDNQDGQDKGKLDTSIVFSDSAGKATPFNFNQEADKAAFNQFGDKLGTLSEEKDENVVKQATADVAGEVKEKVGELIFNKSQIGIPKSDTPVTIDKSEWNRTFGDALPIGDDANSSFTITVPLGVLEDMQRRLALIGSLAADLNIAAKFGYTDLSKGVYITNDTGQNIEFSYEREITFGGGVGGCDMPKVTRVIRAGEMVYIGRYGTIKNCTYKPYGQVVGQLVKVTGEGQLNFPLAKANKSLHVHLNWSWFSGFSNTTDPLDMQHMGKNFDCKAPLSMTLLRSINDEGVKLVMNYYEACKSCLMMPKLYEYKLAQQKTFRHVFGLPEQYTHDDVEEAYRNMLVLWHPEQYKADQNRYDYAMVVCRLLHDGREFLHKAI